MKILQLTKYYPPQLLGGIEIVTYDITEGVNELGMQCDVVCANMENKNLTERNKKYTIYRAATLYNLFSTALSTKLISILKTLSPQYNIIQVHMPNPMAMLAVYLARPKAKIILHWHNDIVKQKIVYFFIKPLETWLLKRADIIVGTSPTYVKGSVALKNFLNKTTVIPLGIDTNRLKYTDKRLQEIAKTYTGKKIIFSVGRLIYYKSFDVLINAANYLDGQAIILIAGAGELKENLEKQITENGLNEKVKLLGRVSDEDLACYYKLCDIFCLPSAKRTEGFGAVQLEAMYFGKPIIATKIPGSGVSWVNQDGITGFNVPINDAKAIADAAKKILSNPRLYQKFSNSATKRFYDNFTKGKMVNAFVNLYKKILE